MQSLSCLLYSILLATSAWAVGPTMPNGTFGNAYNFWSGSPSHVDLTRGAGGGVAMSMSSGSSDTITILPNISALVIVDMQNYFLHPNLTTSSLGRDLVPATIDAINTFRANGMKILWVQWGLTDLDLITIAPNFLFSFGSGDSEMTFGKDMGPINDNGTIIDMGPKLMRGSWNAQAWGDLLPIQQAGIANGTDFYFNKNRLSGMWGVKTPLQQFLEDEGLTTLFFGGVNTDQCVYGTLLDSAYKGYDTILMTDLSATTSPTFATEMVVFNAGSLGWIANTTSVLSALS